MTTTSAYFLTSQRLGFRTWSRSDLNLARRLWGDPKVTRFIVAGGRMSEVQIAARLDQEIAAFAAHGIQYWPIFIRQDHTFAGCCGLRPYDERKETLELGFHICSHQWRRGLATEAARAAMAYAFDSLQTATLFAGHHPDNAPSGRLLLQLGFRYTHAEYYEPTGLQHPSYRMTAADFDRGRSG